VYYTSVINPDYFKTFLYHDDPLSVRSLKPPLVGVVSHRAKVTVHACDL